MELQKQLAGCQFFSKTLANWVKLAQEGRDDAKQSAASDTDSNHVLPVALNLLLQNFMQNRCNRVWVSDVTYIPTREGWLYLAGIKDLCSKEVVRSSLSPRMDTELVTSALHRAVHVHRPLPDLTLHSDRGSQYCSHAYPKNVKKIPNGLFNEP